MPNEINTTNRGSQLLNNLNAPTNTTNRGSQLMGFTSPSVTTPQVQSTYTPPTPQLDFGQKVISLAKNVISQVQEKGIGGFIADALIPPAKQQPEEVKQQNLKSFVEGATGKGAEILASVGADLVDETTKQFAASGSALIGILNKDLLTEPDKKLLQDRGYFDSKGNVKVGKTAIETAKNVFNLSIFFPELFIPAKLISKAATGENVINVFGKAVPVAKILEGQIIGATFNTIYTPNLEKILTDPKVGNEALKNFFVGQGIGGLISIPVSMLSVPETPAFQKLSSKEQQEVQTLKIQLARKYHPNSMLPTASDEAWRTIQGKIESGDIKWLRKLSTASSQEAGKILNMTVSEVTSTGKQLTEKAGTVADIQATERMKTDTGKLIQEAENIANKSPTIEGQQRLLQIRKELPEVQRSQIDPILSFYKPVATATQEGSSNLELANQKIGEALQKYDTGPVEAGFTRTYQVIEKGQKTPWVFDSENGLRQFVGHNDVSTSDIKIKDIPTDQLKSEGNGTFTIKEAPKVETSQVPKENLPVGEGKTKASKLSERMQESIQNVSPEVRSSIPTYKQMSKKDQIEKAAQYVTDKPEEAMQVLQGIQDPPEGLLYNSVYLAMQESAKVGEDISLIQDLASLRSTRFGQEISMLTEADPTNPVNILQKVRRVKVEALEKKNSARVEKVIKNEVNKVRKEIKVPDKYDWDAFVQELEC